jgi:uncharacterized membrane protein YgcG
VSVIRVMPTPRGAGHLFRAVMAAWLLVLALVVPAGAVEGPTKLIDAAASATSATPTTTITFTVTYRNREGSAPAYVRVVIDGRAHDMTSDGTVDWRQGVRYHYATKLPSGTHGVEFIAADTRKFNNQVSGGTITVTIATPTPTPKPVPTPTPTPKPTPTPAPGGTGGSGGSGGTGGSGGGNPGATGGGIGGVGGSITDDSTTPGAGGDGTGSASGDSTSAGAGSGGSGDSTIDTQTWGRGTGDPREYGASPTGSTGAGDTTNDGTTDGVQGPVAGGLTPGGGSSGASGGGSTGAPTGGGSGGSGPAGNGGGGSLELASALEALGLNGPTSMPFLPTLVSTTGAVAMAMAFAIFGKKRRDEEQPAPDEVLEANAARASAVAASSQLAIAPAPAPVDVESLMPRWRRPSLQQARKADPTRYVATAPRLQFDESMNGIGYERRVIRYRVVSLLDAPDELRAVEIGQLDQGDEVQLLERSGAYWLVLCPDGRQGWLHKMTLGDVVAAETASAADAWNVGDIDGDVLSAYLAARARV